MCLAAVLAFVLVHAQAQTQSQKRPEAKATGPNTNAAAMTSVPFKDEFHGQLKPGWSWLRENRSGWRISSNGLEVLIESGNMWGPQNDARNVLLRPAPELEGGKTIEIMVTMHQSPTNQYEQADLAWYLDDSNMVKLGEELVDGKLSVVMGREEKDKTKTISITPLDSETVRLRMVVGGGFIFGLFQTSGSSDWKRAGACELPKSDRPEAKPKVSLQFYQGVTGSGHWALVKDLQMDWVK